MAMFSMHIYKFKILSNLCSMRFQARKRASKGYKKFQKYFYTNFLSNNNTFSILIDLYSLPNKKLIKPNKNIIQNQVKMMKIAQTTVR